MHLTPTSLDLSTLPPQILPYFKDTLIYDSSCSEQAHTYCLKGERTLFLKLDNSLLLDRETALLNWLKPTGLVPEVIAYEVCADIGYLLTAALPGEDAISPRYLKHPARLAELMGFSLAHLHSLPVQDCPYPQRNAELLAEAELNISRGYIDTGICSLPFDQAAQRFHQLKSLPLQQVFIHGDFCLPNIILQDWQVSGYVDLGTGGIADPHYDLFWGVWTLNYNLKTPAYGDTFLTAYGINKVDKIKLELCHLIASFTS
jgi:kanamycin kinase